MKACVEAGFEKFHDCALAFYSAYTFELTRSDFDGEMGLACAVIADMTGVFVRVVDDLHAFWCESFRQNLVDLIFD